MITLKEGDLAAYFSARSLEAMERIVEIISLRGSQLPTRTYIRSERYKYDGDDLGPRAPTAETVEPLGAFQRSAHAVIGGIEKNPWIQVSVQRRSFAFTTMLAKGVPAQAGQGGAVGIEWSDIVKRMVAFGRNHYFESGTVGDDTDADKRHAVQHDDNTQTCIVSSSIGKGLHLLYHG